jgi:DNA-binding SARP family transcriptional activator/WD40 repeat protein
MDIRVLGPVEASAGGKPVLVGAGKPRALLALLALNAGSPVATDRLVEGLWGDEPPATAAKMVQLYVSQLRKALADGGNGAEIVTRGRGYELRLGDGELDARRFEQLVAAGAARDALSLWRGAPLADVADEPFAAAEIRRLDELRVAALELAIDGDLAAGRHREVAGELAALVAEHPLREGLHAQRMLALYRCGRQAEALDAYRQARSVLVEEIGVEPGPDLRRLHEAILRQDPELDPPAADAVELPPELDAGTPLVGREAELDALREQWRRARSGAGRLVLVAGARGMGKTRLVAELAGEVRRDRGAVLYASGAGVSETALQVLAGARVARRPTLLVLDDVDRAGEETWTALGDLVGEVAALRVLVVATAEEPGLAAGLGAEVAIVLAPLDADGVRAVVRLYAGEREDAEVPVERLAEASGGVPQRLHRAAGEWARTLVVRRLTDTASRIAAERPVLRAAEDDMVGNIVELQAARERAERWPVEAEGVVACPFKGLASFDVDDVGVFFGRERLVAEMVARLTGAPLMGIVGPSGSGKSSALRAGLLAALAAGVLPGSEGWALALLRPGEHPLRALAQATAEAEPRGRLVIAVDQFEEAFTACRDESERAAFVDALIACARDPRRRALVLVAVRADFYGRCAAYPELWRLLGANQVPVGPMRRDELRRAIELPAGRAGLRVEPDLTDALIADVEGAPGALPLLSTSLLELWQRRDGRTLRLSAYEQAGGVHGAVARLAESAYERLDAERRQIARRILLRLVGEGQGDTVVRARVPLDEFGEQVRPVLDALTDARLLTISEGEVEVAHEALLREWPRFRGWLEEDVQGRHLHHQLRNAAREWDAVGRDPGELYRGARLASTLEWATDHEADLNATERAFLADSRSASERSQRQLRAVLAGVAALLVVAVIAGVVALDQRGNALDEAAAAEAQQLGARALLDPQLDRSILLARQAVDLDDTVRTQGNLLGALLRSPAAIGVIRADRATILSAAVNPDGSTLAIANIAGQVLFFDTRTRRHVATLEPTPNKPAIQALAYSPDGSRLAVAYTSLPGATAEYPAGWRFLVALVDGHTRRVVERLAMPRERAIAGVQFSHDSRTLGVTLYSLDGVGSFRRFDTGTGRRSGAPVPVEHPGRLTFEPFQSWPRSPVMTTSDGRRVVVGGVDGVTVRDAATLSVLKRFPEAGKASIRTLPTAYALRGDDRTVAIGGEDGSLRLLDLTTGTLQTASGRHRAAVNEARFTRNGRTVVTAGEDDDVILWDVRQAAAAETLSGHARSVFSPQIADAGKTLYTASLDGTVLIWDLVGRRRLGQRFTAGAGNTRPRYALSSDGRLLAHGQADGAISLVDVPTLTLRGAFPVVSGSGVDGPSGVQGIAFVPGSHLLVVGGTYGSVSLVDADRGQVIKRLDGHPATYSFRGTVTPNDIWTPGMSADGSLLATASKDGTLRFWSLPDGRARGAPLRFPHGAADAQLSPNGRWLSVVALNHENVQDRLEIWDVRRRQRVKTLRPPGGAGFGRFSPDGRFLAVGDLRGRVQAFTTATWKPATPSFAGGRATWAAFTRDGRKLATGNTDGTVRLWDIATGQALGAPLPGIPNAQVVPIFTPDDTHLIAAYLNGRAYRWDIRPASLVRQACEVAGRRLTREEWDEFLPGREYAPKC